MNDEAVDSTRFEAPWTMMSGVRWPAGQRPYRTPPGAPGEQAHDLNEGGSVGREALVMAIALTKAYPGWTVTLALAVAVLALS